jgi:DNA-binding LacI/PurR family transcriptional regulator
VAVAVRDDMRPTDLPFVDALVTDMLPVLRERDCRLVRLYGHTDDVVWTLADYVRRWRLSGMVLVSLHSGDPLPRLLHDTGFPVVTVGMSEIEGIPFVEADNRGGGRVATAHLISRGAQRIGVIIGSLRQLAMTERLEGFREAKAEAGVVDDPDLIEAGLGTHSGGRAAMQRMLENVPGLDAVFVGSDLMAEGALEALDAARVRVPHDLKLVCFDDTPESRKRNLTVVSQPVGRMGHEVARLMLERLYSGRPVESMFVPTQLIVRGST